MHTAFALVNDQATFPSRYINLATGQLLILNFYTPGPPGVLLSKCVMHAHDALYVLPGFRRCMVFFLVSWGIFS